MLAFVIIVHFTLRLGGEADDRVDLKAEQRCQGRRFDRDLGR